EECARIRSAGEAAVGRLVVVGGQGNLLQVVGALGAARGLTGRLHRRQQEGDQDGDDRNHDQEFDQGETTHETGRRSGDHGSGLLTVGTTYLPIPIAIGTGRTHGTKRETADSGTDIVGRGWTFHLPSTGGDFQARKTSR